MKKAAAKGTKKPRGKAAQKTPERRRRRGRRAEDLLPDFRDLIDNAVQGVVVHQNFRAVYANEAFARLFGFKSAREVLAMPLLRPLVPPENWAMVEQRNAALLRGKNIPPINRERAQTIDGRELWINATRRVIDWHGTPAMQVNVFDVSDHMKTEQQLLATEQRLRAVLEVLPYPVAITRRKDGQILFVNRKTCLLLGRSGALLRKMKLFDFFADPEDATDFHTMLDTIKELRELEIRMKNHGGREFMAEVAAILTDYSGEGAVLVALNDISQRKQLEAELFHQATTDALTGISNRRHFLDQGEQELRRARRFARDLTLLMLDIDHFKAINDTHGHAAGDIVIQQVVKACQDELRQTDLIGRLGGEEFAILLPETGMKAATETAGRLRAAIADRKIPAGKIAVQCTISVGLTQLEAQDGDIDALLARADAALYRAKQAGRNRVEAT
ncbi:MAG: diguanylate cyclase [Alphaproteobacteria bacterium]|nr:diguanylate cyclase [Alphaproteobacteria bacterium]